MAQRFESHFLGCAFVGTNSMNCFAFVFRVGGLIDYNSIFVRKIKILRVLQCFLFQKLQGIVRDLQEIDKLRHKVSDIQLPLEVFDYIDSGRNPQLYTKDCMEKAVSKNEEVIFSSFSFWVVCEF